MAPDSNASLKDTYVLYWPTQGGGAHVFQVRTSDKLGNENSMSGLINVKEVKETRTFSDWFRSALPIIWFVLFILLVIAVCVLAYTGVLTKWMRGEGMKKDEDGAEKKAQSPKKKVTDADTWEPVRDK